MSDFAKTMPAGADVILLHEDGPQGKPFTVAQELEHVCGKPIDEVMRLIRLSEMNGDYNKIWIDGYNAGAKAQQNIFTGMIKKQIDILNDKGIV